MTHSGTSNGKEGSGDRPAASVPGAALVPDTPDGAPPLLDLTAIQLLEDQLDNPLIARTFVRDFTRLWEKRYRALAVSIAGHDAVAALEAVLSLKTSSTMVGGIQLALKAAELENVIRSRDLREARDLLPGIAQCGEATVAELQVSYVLRSA